MTTSQPPQGVQRAKPVGFYRVAIAYLLTLISVALGGVAFIGAMIGAQTCDKEGFACLGWLVVGAAAWAVLAIVLLGLLAWKQRLGLLFVAITVALVVVAVITPGIEPVRVAVALLAPALAAWVSAPRAG